MKIEYINLASAEISRIFCVVRRRNVISASENEALSRITYPANYPRASAKSERKIVDKSDC